MDDITRALRHRVDVAEAGPATTPLFQASAFEASSPFFYSRKDNPNVKELEEAIAILEGAAFGVATSSGMSALSLALSFLRAGDALVVNRLMYGCSTKLFQRVADRLGLRLQVLDLSTDEGVAAIDPAVRMVIFETPTNPFLRTVDIAAVARAAKARRPDALVVVDNTWATPLRQRPLAHGADLSLHSATKYISGHSDAMGGLVLTDRPELAEALRDERFYAGAVLDPHTAWLLRRSVQTLEIRLQAQERTARAMREWLAARPEVARVDFPHVDGRQLTGCGGILFFALREDLADRYLDLRDALQLFGTGTAMACVTSMVAQPWSGSHASMADDEKRAMGLDRGLVRLCFGLERVEDLQADLAQAFARITGAPAPSVAAPSARERCRP